MFYPSETNFGFIKVNKIQMGSAVRIGSNVQIGIHNTRKTTHGFGVQYADSSPVVLHNAVIDDRDLLDAPAVTRHIRIIQY